MKQNREHREREKEEREAKVLLARFRQKGTRARRKQRDYYSKQASERGGDNDSVGAIVLKLIRMFDTWRIVRQLVKELVRPTNSVGFV